MSGDGPDPYWDPMELKSFKAIKWPTLVRAGWFDMFLKGGLRVANGVSDEARCFGLFGCTTTLVVDALGHAGLDGIPDCELCFPYNATAQNTITTIEYALAALLFFTFQGATNNVLAAGLEVV